MNRDFHFVTRLIQKKRLEISLGLLCTILIILIPIFHIPIASSLLNQANAYIYDHIIQLNLRPHTENPKVVIIDIDERSVQTEGRWPWPRDKMADLLNKLKQEGVVTIGMDIVMSEAEINYALGLKDKLQQTTSPVVADEKQLLLTLNKIAPHVDNDKTFVHQLVDHNTVLGFLFHYDSAVKKGVLPPPLSDTNGTLIQANKLSIYNFQGYNGSLKAFIDASGKAGFVTNLPDKDGTVRHALVVANYNSQLYPSLALATAMNYLLVDKVSLLVNKGGLYGVKLDENVIPTNSLGQILLPYWGKPGTLSYYSATDVLKNKIPAKELEGCIAIIGSSMTLLADLHQSPVAQLFPGVEMVGNMIEGILGQQLVTPYNWNTGYGIAYYLLFGTLFAFLFAFSGVYGKIIIALASIVIILVAEVWLFAFKNLYVTSAIFLLIIIVQALVNYIYSYIVESRKERKISQLFSQYVPKDYVKELINSTAEYSMEGQTLTMTVQFADIRNFTTVSETLDANGVKHLLNTFFTPITEIIFQHRGTIDKYVGDMIVAFWGAPLQDDDHAYHAILSSIIIFQKLPEINAKMIEQSLPVVNIGVGLATGLMNVGDMGSEFRRAYTVLGDTVNLSSRLQDLTKFYQVDILVNDMARSGQEAFLWRRIDKVTVKGRKTALIIYQPICLLNNASTTLQEEVREYEVALDYYYAQKWSSAETAFGTLRKQYPLTYIYQLYLERITEFKRSPPPENWDGVYKHSHK